MYFVLQFRILKYIYCIAFVCLSFYTKATKPEYLDSVLQRLRTTTNIKDQLNCLYTLSYEYGLINPPLGIYYGNRCLELAIKHNDLVFQLNANNGIANAYETLNNYDSAKFYHQRSYEIARIAKKPRHIALTLTNVALCNKQLAQYDNALNQYLLAYKFFEKESTYNPRIHFYISEIYMHLGDFSKAEFHTQIGIKRSIEYNYDDVTKYLLINHARWLQHIGNIDSAEHVLNKVREDLVGHYDVVCLCLCLHTLGNLYSLKKDYTKAYNCFVTELGFQQKLSNTTGIYLANIEIAYSLALINPQNKQLVNTHINKALNFISKIKSNIDILIPSIQKIARVYEALNEHKQALSYNNRYIHLKDSILTKEKQAQLMDIQTKYETNKKELEIIHLKQSNQINALELRAQQYEVQKRNILIASVLLGLLLMVIIFYTLHQKQNIKKQLEKQLAITQTEEKERQRISKDLHDELGSGLSKINFLSELLVQDKNQSTQSIQTAKTITETARQLISNMRDLIWVLQPDNNQIQELLIRIREYASDYLDDFCEDVTFDFPAQVDHINIIKEANHDILMIVKECLNNIVKHSKATQVLLSIKMMNQSLTITIQDNGIGMDVTKPKNGNGLRNLVARIQALGGKQEVKSTVNIGTTFIFDIPLHAIVRNK